MIIVKVRGGLGNQMSQYAAGRALSILINTKLAIDTSWFALTKADNRSYLLHNFNIEAEHISQIPNNYALFFEKSYIFFQPDFFTVKDNTILEGTWLSEKYFKDKGSIIRKDFILQDSNIDSLGIINNNSVSIHIRRTDKVNHNFHLLLPLSYYIKALKFMNDQFNDLVVYIFSDDIEWVKDNLKISQKHYFINYHGFEDCYKDVYLMSLCKHNIIANSSFSWWGAWLNTNPNKQVIAPKEWYKTESIYYQDHYPKGWLVL